MSALSNDGAAFDALTALHAEGYWYYAELTAGDLGVRARLTLSRGTLCVMESGATLSEALARCATVLLLDAHPAVRAVARHAETIPAPAETG